MPKQSKRTEIFAPLPARVIGDEQLTSLDLRVLACLAAHDRFSANGIGCYASHPRLASLVKCHLKSLSRSLRTLAKNGYIDAEPHPSNRRRRVYRVRYTGADDAVLRQKIGSELIDDGDQIGNELVTINGAIGNRDEKRHKRYQCDASPNILGETYKISRETVPSLNLVLGVHRTS